MKIIPVDNTNTQKEFIEVSVSINKNLPNYIRPLDNEINEIFTPEKNKNFQYGKLQRWILKSNDGKLLGRIAGFVSTKYINKGTEFVTGCIGFFECVNDQPAANLLFDTAKSWLQLQDCVAMDGPVNFGDRDKYWGLLVEGFDKEPIYGMPFNHPYYQDLFENYGFKNFYNQYWFAMSVHDDLPARFPERYAKFKAKPEYSTHYISLGQIEKYAADFATVYNAAWAQHAENKTITTEEVIKLFKTMKPVMDEKLIWFAYYKEDPIAMFINLPDINQYFKHFNGKLGLWQKLQFLWLKKTMKQKKLIGLVFGIVPKYQALGVDSFMIQECSNLIKDKDWYDAYEMGWAGEWNPKMINVYKSLGATQSRRMVTYRYIFDEAQYPFERHPVMDYK